ncbi:MAG: right-handed parallel beta-helix repeat-containing protein [Acidimicrobiia bacterium]|nr:right-handed parallel beta-helix repeat-containing protein [Acidimicrobiia bacterium]
MVRLTVLAALTALLVGAPTIGRALDLPLGLAVEPAAAAGASCGPYQPLAPSGGVERSVSNQAELAAALAVARPGDVINLADGVYTRIDYRLDQGHRSGTASAPIVIQAAAGAAPIIDAGDNGTPSYRFAVSIIRMAHVTVRGLEIRNGIFGALSRGSASITFEHNHIHDLAQVGVVTGAAETAAGYEPSSNTVIRCNTIHDTGMLDPEFGEGIYVGTGRTGAVDRTSGVLIEGNEIHSIANEAVDVKRYTTNVTIRNNLIHDVTPYYGGAISLGLNRNDWGPANYLVEENRIWNVSSGRHYAQAIAVAHGPTVIRNNTIWNVDTRITDSWPWTATIQVHGDDNEADWAYGFGNPAMARVDIIGNTIIGCNQGCIKSHTDPGEIRPTLTVQSNIVDRASTGDAANSTDIVVSAGDLVGPVTGTADSGSGPGSGLRLRPSPPTTTSPPPTTSTTVRRSTTVSAAPPTSAPETESAAPPSTEAGTDSEPRPRPSAAAPSIPITRPSPPSSSQPATGVTEESGTAPAVDRNPIAPPDPRSPGVATTIRQPGSISTTRSTTKPSTQPAVVNHWRRSLSDLRVFLEANLGPPAPSASVPEASVERRSPNSPDWLVALMTPAEAAHMTHRWPTTIDEQAQLPTDNATTAPNHSGPTKPKGRRVGDDLPTTTRPAGTAGLGTTTR